MGRQTHVFLTSAAVSWVFFFFFFAFHILAVIPSTVAGQRAPFNPLQPCTMARCWPFTPHTLFSFSSQASAVCPSAGVRRNAWNNIYGTSLNLFIFKCWSLSVWVGLDTGILPRPAGRGKVSRWTLCRKTADGNRKLTLRPKCLR